MGRQSGEPQDFSSGSRMDANNLVLMMDLERFIS